MLRHLTANTAFYINNVTGAKGNHGFTRECAFPSIQYAWTCVKNNINANDFAVEFLLCNTGVPYSGGIITYFIHGLPHDYGVVFRGEKGPDGTAAVLIEDSADGGFCVGGNAQIYVRDLLFRSHGNAPCIIAAFDGFVTIDNCVFYGAENAPILATGPRGGAIDINSPWWIIDRKDSPTLGKSALSAVDTSKGISITEAATCYVGDNPKFSEGFAWISDGGKIQTRNAWLGTARGKKFVRQPHSYFLPDNPAFPGDQPGTG